MGNGLAARSGSGFSSRAPIVFKTHYLAGLQCPKLLWHTFRSKDLLPEPDPAQQAAFDQGREASQLARGLFPDGLDVGDGTADLGQAIQMTAQALKLRRPVYEATFAAGGACCRVDVLKPYGGTAWEIAEVKSTTSAKDIHRDDLAFQAWVLSQAGVKVRAAKLVHLNSDYVRQGAVDPKGLFTATDLTAEVSGLLKGVQGNLAAMASTICLKEPPPAKIGPQCDAPYLCPLQNLCWASLPEDNVLTLYRGTAKGFKLLDQGITSIKDIPQATALTANQKIQREVARSGQPHMDRPAIQTFLKRLRYPLHFLDFETFSTAIPLFDGTHPYQQVPFQWSCHILPSAGAEPEHRMFLAEGRGDSRPEFIRTLRSAIGPAGSVVVYNAAFERSRLRECCAALPEYAPWVAQADQRIVDLLEPFRSFHYYHPKQRGSASMKAVLPALVGKGYDHLDIQDGSAASREFLRVTFGDVPEAEQQLVRRQLEAYCGQDTLGMVWILRKLERLI